jgi:hypothetical protein
MSTKKEPARSTTDNDFKNEPSTERTNAEYDVKRELRPAAQEQNRAVERTINETRDNIKRAVDEARTQIPRNTQAINDYQERHLQAAQEIADSYLNSQKEIISSFQSAWAPHIENYYNMWNNWASPRRAAEIYARAVSNFADNTLTATRIGNNAIVANIETFNTILQRRKDDAKEFSRIGVNTARTFAQTSSDVISDTSRGSNISSRNY